MNAHKATFYLVVLLLLLAFTVAVASPLNDSIIINGAHEVRTTSVNMPQSLRDTLDSVGPRIVLQYANELRSVRLAAVPSSFLSLLDQVSARVVAQYADAIRSNGLVAVPSALQALLDQVSARVVVQYTDAIRGNRLIAVPGALQAMLDQVSARVVVQYANTVRTNSLVAMPSALQSWLGQVSDRVVFQYANANRGQQLTYPTALINDATPPQISGVTANTVGVSMATISWTTDEFANSTVLYGTQPGSYSQIISDPLFTKQHGITLAGLTPGATYYCKVRSADRSGNANTSEERVFTVRSYVYLPLVVRSSQ